jgi:adenosine deaminase
MAVLASMDGLMDGQTQPDGALTTWLRAMPKAELHLHLDGSLRPATALALAHERGVDLGDSVDETAMRARLTAPARCVDQADLLRAFDLPIALLQDAASLERVAFELVEDVASDGTHYAEIRWAPSLHTVGGLEMRDGIEAVIRGARAGARASGISIGLIVVALRTHTPAIAVEVAELAGAAARADISGFDLAGREQEQPDARRFSAAFEVARGGDLGISCHAGEWGGAAQVRHALTVGPWRIAHGAPAVDDLDLIEELIRRGVTLDICPTSNLQAGIGSADQDAPLPRLVRMGAPVTLSTDSRTVSDVTLIDEMGRAIERLGVTSSESLGLVRHAHAAAFLHHDESLRSRLRATFEAWAAAHPEPGS